MPFDLQKAGMWKRISAFLFDSIILTVIAVLFVLIVSWITGYDKKSEQYAELMSKYETQYDTSFSYSEEDFNALPENEKEKYQTAYKAFIQDEEVLKSYSMVMNLTLIMITAGIFLAFMLWEFLIPLKLGNGRTLGKKIFGLGVMRTDAVKITAFQLFIRAILGKYTIETMIPVLVVVMIYFNTVGLMGTLLILAILIAQIVCMIATHTNSCLHDLMAVTVVIDMPSQMIFDTYEDMIAYKEKYYAEKAARSQY